MKITVPLISLLLAALPAAAAEKTATVWKSQSCGCCTGWVKHLERNGYQVTTVDTEDMDAVKDRFGVPETVRSCHTARIGGYLVEGHVPAEAIDKLLKERPKVTGIASPGMPQGSPGMSGPKEDNVIHAFSPEGTWVIGKY